MPFTPTLPKNLLSDGVDQIQQAAAKSPLVNPSRRPALPTPPAEINDLDQRIVWPPRISVLPTLSNSSCTGSVTHYYANRIATTAARQFKLPLVYPHLRPLFPWIDKWRAFSSMATSGWRTIRDMILFVSRLALKHLLPMLNGRCKARLTIGWIHILAFLLWSFRPLGVTFFFSVDSIFGAIRCAALYPSYLCLFVLYGADLIAGSTKRVGSSDLWWEILRRIQRTDIGQIGQGPYVCWVHSAVYGMNWWRDEIQDWSWQCFGVCSSSWPQSWDQDYSWFDIFTSQSVAPLSCNTILQLLLQPGICFDLRIRRGVRSHVYFWGVGASDEKRGSPVKSIQANYI